MYVYTYICVCMYACMYVCVYVLKHTGGICVCLMLVIAYEKFFFSPMVYVYKKIKKRAGHMINLNSVCTCQTI